MKMPPRLMLLLFLLPISCAAQPQSDFKITVSKASYVFRLGMSNDEVHQALLTLPFSEKYEDKLDLKGEQTWLASFNKRQFLFDVAAFGFESNKLNSIGVSRLFPAGNDFQTAMDQELERVINEQGPPSAWSVAKNDLFTPMPILVWDKRNYVVTYHFDAGSSDRVCSFSTKLVAMDNKGLLESVEHGNDLVYEDSKGAKKALNDGRLFAREHNFHFEPDLPVIFKKHKLDSVGKINPKESRR